MILRELAFQISEQFVVLGNSMNIRTAVIVGGMDMMAQALELGNRPHIVIATPGRIVDHLKSGSGEWNLSRVKFLVGIYAFITTVKRFTRDNCRFLMKQIDCYRRALFLNYLICSMSFQKSAKPACLQQP